MLYPAALTSSLLSAATLALTLDVSDPDTPSGARAEIGAFAEYLLGAAGTAYEGDKAAQAARIIALEMNHLVGLGVATSDVSALILQSETRGARSHTHKDAGMVPAELLAQFAALDETADPTPTTPTTGAARFLAVRSLR